MVLHDVRGHFRVWLYPALLFAAFVFSGCTKVYHFNTPDYVPAYPKPENTIPLKVALHIPEESREFAYSFVYKRWALGEALESHMLNGLKAAFGDAAITSEPSVPSGFDRVAVCTLEKSTDIKIGTVGSDKIATIGLVCRIEDATKSVRWEGRVNRTETFNAGIVGTMLRVTAFASVFIRSVDVAGAEEMYDAMITSGSNNTLILTVDEMINKIVKDGRTRICPGCR